MNEDKNLSRRITVFVKNNMNTIILILICVSYVLYGMLTVEETGKTIQEIIGSGALSALAGFLIKTSRAKSGIIDGMNSQMFIIKTNAYGKKKEEISNAKFKLEQAENNYDLYREANKYLWASETPKTAVGAPQRILSSKSGYSPPNCEKVKSRKQH